VEVFVLGALLAVGNKVHLQESRSGLVPVGEGAYRDLVFEDCTGPGGAAATQGFGPVGFEEAIDGSRTQLHEERFRLRPDHELGFPLEHSHDLWKEGGQALGTDAPTCFPHHKRGSAHVGSVQARSAATVQVPRAVAAPKVPNRRFAVAGGEGHEPIKDPALFRAAGPKVPGPPVFH